MKLGLALDESRKTTDSSDVMTPPEFRKLRRFGNVQNLSNLEAHILRSDYAIVTGLAPK